MLLSVPFSSYESNPFLGTRSTVASMRFSRRLVHLMDSSLAIQIILANNVFRDSSVFERQSKLIVEAKQMLTWTAASHSGCCTTFPSRNRQFTMGTVRYGNQGSDVIDISSSEAARCIDVEKFKVEGPGLQSTCCIAFKSTFASDKRCTVEATFGCK
jgi:hypothetical protein